MSRRRTVVLAAASVVAFLVIVTVYSMPSPSPSIRATPAGATGSPGSATPSGVVAGPRVPGASGGAGPRTTDSWIAQENALPGTPNWAITAPVRPSQLAGFTDRVSVASGQSTRLFVSTTFDSFTVTAFRMGYYGGIGARRIWESDRIMAVKQPKPILDTSTNTVSAADWTPSATISTAGWPAGDYLLRLDASGGSRYVPLTVRTDDNRDRLVVMNAVTTWEAYNDWGGYSLYHGPHADPATRAKVVSFDRPYQMGRTDDGSSDFVGLELPLVQLAERQGLNLGYTTDVDVNDSPTVLAGARGLISLGHDEYWSVPMRRAVESARDSGMNLAFLGANAVFRRIRLEPSLLGPDRREVNYRASYREDPLYGKDNAQVTNQWREPPAPKPESSLTGVFYECNPVKADMVITNPSFWMWAGAGVTQNLHLAGLVGSEYDRVNPGFPVPHPIEVVAHSPVICRKAPSFSDIGYYTTPSGAGVIDVGTNSWVAGLVPDGVTSGSAGAVLNRVVTTATTNLLNAFAAGPAGISHPAQENLAKVGELSGYPPGL